MDDALGTDKEGLLRALWDADPDIERILRSSDGLPEARDRFFEHLNSLERHYFNIYSDRHFRGLHVLERNNAKQCIRVLKNVIRTENEKLTDSSALRLLCALARDEDFAQERVSEGFLCEFLALFRGINGRSGLTEGASPGRRSRSAGGSGAERSRMLDVYAGSVHAHFRRYRHGLEPGMVEHRRLSAEKLQRKLGARPEEWRTFSWQMGHIVRDPDTLASLVRLEPDEVEGLRSARECEIPFQITPYYLSLFNEAGRCRWDSGIRAQVIPSATYCQNVRESREQGMDMDFMQERWTSPVEAITRRYPLVLILKPFGSCPQLCVYCQRNWEITGLDQTRITKAKVEAALGWIGRNRNISEVLVTGGDPLALPNIYIGWLLGRLAAIPHVERIRIGTRVPVTLPYRIDPGLLRLLRRYHRWGEREICIVTHFEHAAEVTPDALEAVRRLRSVGLNVYNQQVFTYYNSRRFETALLRRVLKLSGVNPYYSFITKGKDETVDFRVPLARIQQEVAEEARLLPGVVRSDEAVFNVPRLGKSYLRAWQDHEPIMILPDGRRVYRFYPWEAHVGVADDYIYTDVSIHAYLSRLRADGENTADFGSIWYYF